MTTPLWSDLAAYVGPTANEYPGAMGPVMGLVLHIQQGTEAGSIAWCKNPAAKVSAHFSNPKAGPMVQLVPVTDAAWAEVGGNLHWISVENEGMSGDALTDSQLEHCAQLLARIHADYGVPLVASDSPAAGIPGLTGHGLGGAAWGGHTDCPGAPVLAQRHDIITQAAAIAGAAPTHGGTDMNLNDILGPVSAGMAALVPDDGTEGLGEGATYTVGAALMGITERTAEILILVKEMRAELDAVKAKVGA